MASEEVKQQVSISSDKLQDVRKSMRAFSLSARALFFKDKKPRFEKLRDDTRNVAVAYAKGGLPLVKQCVSDIKGYFEHCIDLTKDEWWTSIADKVEKVKAHKEACNALVEIHEYFIKELKTLQDDANILMEKGPDQGTERNRKASAEIAVVATIRDTLVPALSEFFNALGCISGFFAVLQDELETIQVNGEKAVVGEKLKELRYQAMKRKAGRIVNHCSDLIKELTSIRSDLQAIPIERLDDHYVERFLLMANECISRHCTNTKMLNKLKTTLTTGNKKQVTMYCTLEGWSFLEKHASFWGVSPQIFFAVIVCVFIVLFEYFPRALLALIFLARLAYYLFV